MQHFTIYCKLFHWRNAFPSFAVLSSCFSSRFFFLLLLLHPSVYRSQWTRQTHVRERERANWGNTSYCKVKRKVPAKKRRNVERVIGFARTVFNLKREEEGEKKKVKAINQNEMAFCTKHFSLVRLLLFLPLLHLLLFTRASLTGCATAASFSLSLSLAARTFFSCAWGDEIFPNKVQWRVNQWEKKSTNEKRENIVPLAWVIHLSLVYVSHRDDDI